MVVDSIKIFYLTFKVDDSALYFDARQLINISFINRHFFILF